jgi:hypothetical protein
VRGAWVWLLSGAYIFVGVGLIRLQAWARLATIATAFIGVALLGVALLNGFLLLRPIFMIAYLIRLPLNALVVWYLLKPEVVRAFILQDG